MSAKNFCIVRCSHEYTSVGVRSLCMCPPHNLSECTLCHGEVSSLTIVDGTKLVRFARAACKWNRRMLLKTPPRSMSIRSSHAATLSHDCSSCHLSTKGVRCGSRNRVKPSTHTWPCTKHRAHWSKNRAHLWPIKLRSSCEAGEYEGLKH